MNSRSFATKHSPNFVDAERLPRSKPVLFLHIPKTGGSSFLTALGNIFGERRVRRLRCAEEMSDPLAAAFWEPRDPAALVHQALATLRAIEFGLLEDMQSTLTLAQHFCATNFNLDEYRANATDAPGAEWTAHNIHRIVDLNTLDVALYHQAKVLFSRRVRDASVLGQSANGTSSVSVLRVQPGQKTSVNDIPGRRGLDRFEAKDGVGALAVNRTSLIAFLASPKP